MFLSYKYCLFDYNGAENLSPLVTKSPFYLYILWVTSPLSKEMSRQEISNL